MKLRIIPYILLSFFFRAALIWDSFLFFFFFASEDKISDFNVDLELRFQTCLKFLPSLFLDAYFLICLSLSSAEGVKM